MRKKCYMRQQLSALPTKTGCLLAHNGMQLSLWGKKTKRGVHTPQKWSPPPYALHDDKHQADQKWWPDAWRYQECLNRRQREWGRIIRQCFQANTMHPTILKLQPHSAGVLYVHDVLSSSSNDKTHKGLGNLELQHRSRTNSLFPSTPQSTLHCTLPQVY